MTFSIDPKPFTRLDLDTMGCQAPGCTHTDHAEMFVHPRCHPNAGTWVEYRRHLGVLKVSCRKCKAHVASFLVAGAGPS